MSCIINLKALWCCITSFAISRIFLDRSLEFDHAAYRLRLQASHFHLNVWYIAEHSFVAYRDSLHKISESSSEHFASDLNFPKADTPWCENKRCSDSNLWPLDPKASVLPTIPQRPTTTLNFFLSHSAIFPCLWFNVRLDLRALQMLTLHYMSITLSYVGIN